VRLIFWTCAEIFIRRGDFKSALVLAYIMWRMNFTIPHNFSAQILRFYVFANILGRRQYFMILLDFVAANICVYFQYLFMHFVCVNIFGAIVLKT
jgi:hypothetical protein